MIAQRFAYQPDYAVPPGVTIAETLESLNMTQAELARRMGRPLQVVNEIIKGKKAIEPETAIQLERALGIPASFWNNRESQYQDALLRIGEAAELDKKREWLAQFPIKSMVANGYLSATEGVAATITALLKFFAVSDPNTFDSYWSKCQASFRRSGAFSTHKGALIAWLRMGEIEASQIECNQFDEARFRQAVNFARTLTRERVEKFCPELQRTCADAGVAVVFIRELDGGRECGATRWLTSDKALIQLSLRFRTNDHFWFTFFHESGHILLHRKRSSFIDDIDGACGDPEEEEANAFARDTLIPPKEWAEFIATHNFSRTAIGLFADKICIAPGIIAGRLMHDQIMPWKWQVGQSLRVKFGWKPVEAKKA